MVRILMVRLMIAAALALAAASIIATHRAAAATLKPSVLVSRDTVTLGDLFDDAGPLAATAVFRSPELGVTGALPVATALAAAERAGLSVSQKPQFSAVTVIRQSRRIGPETLRALVADAVAARTGAAADSLEVTFDDEPATLNADGGAATPAEVLGVSFQPGSGRFTARIGVDIGAGVTEVELAGRAVETVEVPVLARAVDRSMVIRASDVTLQKVERRRVAATTAVDLDEVVDMAARRMLKAGDVIARSDVEPPKLVRRGQMVTVLLRRPGLALSARGRAVTDAAKGDVIGVVNEQSHRTIQATVTGDATVEVDIAPRAAILASAGN